MTSQIVILPGPFDLERGGRLHRVEVGFRTAGVYRADGTNTVWVCPPLTANADVFAWWPRVFGRGRFFDPARHFIVCTDLLGSAYETTGPLSRDADAVPYFHRFPEVTVRDIVRVNAAVKDHLGLPRVGTLVGPSFGGAQAIEWAVSDPTAFDHLILIACHARQSAFGAAYAETARMAIEADATWRDDRTDAGAAGLQVARAMTVLSYRGFDAYERTQTGTNPTTGRFRAGEYQRHKGEELSARFNAISYHLLTRAMDSHDVGRGRGGVAVALQRIRARVLAVALSSDLRYPPREQQELAELIPGAQWALVESSCGHDGFLLEADSFAALFHDFFDQSAITRPCACAV